MKSRVQDCRKCRQQIHDEEAEKYLKKEYSFFEEAAYAVFKIKKKLMLYFHNIQVREV